MITIIGLGPGDPGLVTRAAWELLTTARPLYLRTAVHPTIAALPPDAVARSFDALYEQADSFDAVYARIAAELIERASAGESVVYAVPGDPLVAEATTRHLLRTARERGIATRIMSGVSFIEPVCAALGVDPLERGLQLLDALDLVVEEAVSDAPSWASLNNLPYMPSLSPFPLVVTRPALICQVYSRSIASHVKLSLLERYPAAHPVTLVTAAGVAGAEHVRETPLHLLDHHDDIDHLTCLYVPALTPLGDLRGPDGVAYVVARLLGPDGCPWDREQTPQSLRAALLEEAHEVLEALDAEDDGALAEEMGDILMSVFMQSEMARQAGRFDVGDVFEAVTSKLVRRHPHVFGELKTSGSREVLWNWEEIKRAEYKQKGAAPRGALDGIPVSLPALAAAQKLTYKAARAGFDAPEIERAWEVLEEELAELRAETAGTPQAEAELGDALLALTKLGWKLEIDAESALRAASARFRQRFARLEALLDGRDLHSLSIAEKLDLWEQTKSLAR